MSDSILESINKLNYDLYNSMKLNIYFIKHYCQNSCTALGDKIDKLEILKKPINNPINRLKCFDQIKNKPPD